MPSKLEQLSAMTTVVADTGDVAAIKASKPTDCTTNPTLILKAAAMPAYAGLVADALEAGRRGGAARDARLAIAGDRLAVLIGVEMTKLVPGRVSTEVDADLSFSTDATVEKARAIIAAYETLGVGRERILVKIAATWEGIRAAGLLQREGVDCNLTLLFSLAQAAACADAGVFLISPFVGRIMDWHAKATGQTYTAETDPGVLSVRRIYEYYKQHAYKTVVMGASFRNIGEIEALAGCDRLTIAPALLEALAADHGALPRRLSPDGRHDRQTKVTCGEAAFRWALNEDAMATEKLAEGIRQFAKDLQALRATLDAQLDRAA